MLYESDGTDFRNLPASQQLILKRIRVLYEYSSPATAFERTVLKQPALKGKRVRLSGIAERLKLNGLVGVADAFDAASAYYTVVVAVVVAGLVEREIHVAVHVSNLDLEEDRASATRSGEG